MSKLFSSIQLPGSRFRGRRSTIWVFVIYIALSIVMTWPLIATLGQRIPAGTGGDVWANQWAHWWVKQSLTDGISPFFTRLLYFPNGVSLATYNIPWVNIALWLPLQAFIGDYAAYSLLYIAIFAFNCFAMYILVYEWYESIPAAFIAGLIYGFFPYVMSRSGQPNWIFISWLPIALLFLKRTVQENRVRDAIISGIFLALIGITLWHLLILSTLVIAIYLLYLFLNNRSIFSKKTILLLGLSAIIALLIMLPLAWPVLRELLTVENRQEYLLGDEVIKSTNLLAYILPNINLTFWGKIVTNLPLQAQFTSDRIDFIGLTVLLLAALGSFAHWRKAWPWILLSLILIVFALGPVLLVGNSQVRQISLPYQYLGDFFLVRILRHPNRFNIILGLPLALLGGLGILKLQRTRFFSRSPLFLTIALGTIILAEFIQIPYRTTEIDIPDWHEQLAQEQEDFAILDLPMQPGGTDKIFMHYQMTHGKALVGGHVSRLGSDAFRFIEDSTILSNLSQDNTFGASTVDVSHQLKALSNSGIRYIILHKKFETGNKIGEWKDWLTGGAVYEDKDVVVYRTDLFDGADIDFKHYLTDEIGLIDVGFWPDRIDQAEPTRLKIRWAALQAPNEDYYGCIHLQNEFGEISQTDCNAIPKGWPSSNWQRNEVVRGDFDLRIDPFLAPGIYSLNLVLMNNDQEVGKTVLLGTIRVDSRPRIYDIQDTPILVDAIWVDQIALLGHESNQITDALQLTLYWQAMERIGKSYKFFVHLIDLDSGQVVAQVDAIPHDWTYPTDWWDEGEIIIESVELPTMDLNPGTYRLQVGFYDPGNGERLTARSENGSQYADDVVPLTTIEHP